MSKKSFIRLLLIALALSLSIREAMAKDISLSEMLAVMVEGKATVIDVRTGSEFEAGHLPGAVNVDVNRPSFLNDVTSLTGGKAALAVYCKAGRRSETAAKALEAAGYAVYHMRDGFVAWEKEGYPVEKGRR